MKTSSKTESEVVLQPAHDLGHKSIALHTWSKYLSLKKLPRIWSVSLGTRWDFVTTTLNLLLYRDYLGWKRLGCLEQLVCLCCLCFSLGSFTSLLRVGWLHPSFRNLTGGRRTWDQHQLAICFAKASAGHAVPRRFERLKWIVPRSRTVLDKQPVPRDH